MKKKPLTCQSRKVNLVIRKNKFLPLDLIEAYCKENFDRYAFIEHKGDINPQTGLVEGVHYHIVGDMKGLKIAFSTRLNTLAQYFKFDNLHGIEIDQYITFEGSLQYLTHKNQPEKTPHDVKDIHHNLTPDEFEIFYNAEVGNVITFDLIYTICLTSHNLVEVIRGVGVGNYRTWRPVILDIWRSIRGLDDRNTNYPNIPPFLNDKSRK